MMICPRALLISQIQRRTLASGALKRTCLHDFHLEKAGKMVGFAGYSMPIQYADLSIGESHHHTRSHCSIFDVSHMQQSRVMGKDRMKFIGSLTTLDGEALGDNSGSLTIFTNERGGIIDDLIVMNTGEGYLFLVTNAGCKDKDIPLMKTKAETLKKNGLDVELELIDDHGLIAIQGPQMLEILQPLTDVDLGRLKFMWTSLGSVCGVPNCRITRCGYTGEDGVEVFIPQEYTVSVTRQIIESSPFVRLAGLGARDSLRLESWFVSLWE
uniref:Aminomethyltransferase, mitochondrial n=1 Tax=Caligus clemensi TaxID=344056 RepID=C1C1V4_CALCM|nr:Aminomethyltransferase, mitochondrial precursor [Caligus clemensi]